MRLVLGSYQGNLSNCGETLQLTDSQQQVIFTLRYDVGEAWPQAADGEGAALQLKDLEAGLNLNDQNNWTAGGSSGTIDLISRYLVVPILTDSQMQLKFSRRLALDAELTAVLEGSADLVTWQTQPWQVNSIELEKDSENVTLSLSVLEPAIRFVRLRIKQ